MQTQSVNRLAAIQDSSRSLPGAGPLRRRLLLLALLVGCFSLIEAALVAYLRLLLDPQGNLFPLIQFPKQLLVLEELREAATLLLLWSAAALVTRDAAARFGLFLLAFGSWDLLYYVLLHWILAWPPGLTSWDLLFLVPVPWLGPVYAPIVVSIVLVVVGALTLRTVHVHGRFRVWQLHVWGAAIGGVLILASFMEHRAAPMHGQLPTRYSVEFLIAGLAVGIVAYIDVYRRNLSLRRTGDVTSQAGAAVFQRR